MELVRNYFVKIRKKGLRESILLFCRIINWALKIRLEKIQVLYLNTHLSDMRFFKKIDLNFTGLGNTREAVKKRDWQNATDGIIAYFRNRTSPKFFINPEQRMNLVKVINDQYQNSKNATIKRADEIYKHDFQFIVPNLRFPSKVDWLSNLLDNRRWEIKYWRDIDYSSQKRAGDVRLTWELNRHQFFVTLGKAYWYTRDEKYAKEFVMELMDWIANNPYGKTVNWIHLQEIALRIISWIWAYFFFCNSPSFTVDDQIQFLKSLYLQAEFLRKHLSDTKYSPTHNHIVSETTGLAMMAIMFPEFKKSKEWWKDGVDRLQYELRRQICEDGVSGEMATNYHFFVLDSFLQISILLDKNGAPYDSSMKKMLKKMIEFAMYICRPNGTIPIIGDSDSGRSMRLDDLNGEDRRSYLSTGAVLFNRPDMKWVSREFYEESLWLLDEEGFNKFKAIKPTLPIKLSKKYSDSGYCIMRDSWDSNASQLILRGGAIRIPKDVSIGHNHSDYLSFELIVDGKAFLIDPGVYSYNLDDEWRWYSRRTSTHNTVLIDDTDQFVINSQRFGLPKIARSFIHVFKSTNSFDFVHASHDGYERLTSSVTHHRKIHYDKIKKCWTLADIFVGNGKHRFEWYFHFDVGIELEAREGLSVMAILNENTNILINPLQIGGVEFEISDGWVSKRYGAKEKAKILKYIKKSTCPCKLQIEFRAQNIRGQKL